MNESTWLPIGKRIYSHQELCADSSIRTVGFWIYQNWERVHTWYKAVSHMPLSIQERMFVKETLLRPTYSAVYELDRPWVVIYKMHTGELKYFLISAEGNLVEPVENLIWDGAFPFLSRTTGGKLMGMSIPSKVSSLPLSKWVWYPSNANYAHFLFDAFAQIAITQEKLSEEYLNGYDLPLDLSSPAWQDELLQKLFFRHILLPGGDELNQFRIFRINKVLLPVVSHRAIALDWLRDFFARTFLGPNPRSLVEGHGGLVMVTRRDARRARIQNISAIEEMVVEFGGSLVDASGLSCSEKLAIFRSCSVCVAESTGCMNGALFAPEHSRIIALTDPSVINDKNFLVGAWPYFTGYAHRAHFVVGNNAVPLPGSPVGSSSYSLEVIKKLLLEAR